MALMKGIFGATLVLAAVWSASAVGSSNETEAPVRPQPVTTSTTTAAPSTTTVLIISTPSTTQVPTTLSTPSTPPTSAVPTTPSSTTPAPHTTTTVPPNSTIPKEYYWNVTDNEGVDCVLAKAVIKLELTYLTTEKNTIREEFAVSPNSTNGGSCEGEIQTLRLFFNGSNSITFSFKKVDKNDGNYHLTGLESNVTLSKMNATVELSSKVLDDFETQVNTSYECSWSQPALLHEADAGQNSTKATLRVDITNVRVEAFRNSTDNHFSKVYSCSMDSPDIVPIMVGVALAILVVVVLVAYLVGRRSSQAQGYVSM